MGAGNELIKGWSYRDFQPKTFFVDLSIDEKDLQEEVENEETYSLVTEKRTAEELKIIWENEALHDFKQYTFYGILDELNIENTFDVNAKNDYIELSAEFRGHATVIASTENVLIVTCGGESIDHVSFGFVPVFKYEDIMEEVQDKYADKRDYYEKRKKSFEQMIIDRTDENYQKLHNKYKREVKLIMEQMLKIYKDKISIRTGPHQSGKIPSFKMFKVYAEMR